MEEANILRLLADLHMERDFLLEEIEEVNASIYKCLKTLEELRIERN